MPLPPGRGPLPVTGINATTDPELAKSAGELNAWIDYLLHPATHDGPRIYRSTGPDRSGHVAPDAEMPRRTANLEADSGQYQVVSILDRYCDPNVFFRSARTLSGISEPTMNETISN